MPERQEHFQENIIAPKHIALLLALQEEEDFDFYAHTLFIISLAHKHNLKYPK